MSTSQEIQTWLTSYIAKLLRMKPEQIDITIPFDGYGLDSAKLALMTSDLEDWLGQELNSDLLYDYSTIEALAQYLAK